MRASVARSVFNQSQRSSCSSSRNDASCCCELVYQPMSARCSHSNQCTNTLDSYCTSHLAPPVTLQTLVLLISLHHGREESRYQECRYGRGHAAGRCRVCHPGSYCFLSLVSVLYCCVTSSRPSTGPEGCLLICKALSISCRHF